MHKTGIPVSVLRDRVGEVIFERGRRYATEGRVALQRHGPTGAEAVVTGAEDYVVQIEVASRDLAGSCTCPFAEDGFFCKHMVAPVLGWDEAGTEDERRPLPAHPSRRAHPARCSRSSHCVKVVSPTRAFAGSPRSAPEAIPRP